KRSGGDHALHIAVDLARHPRVTRAAADPAQLSQVVLWELAPVVQATPQHDAQDGLVLHARDQGTDDWEAGAADIDRGDAIGSTDTSRVVVGVDGDDAPHPVLEL